MHLDLRISKGPLAPHQDHPASQISSANKGTLSYKFRADSRGPPTPGPGAEPSQHVPRGLGLFTKCGSLTSISLKTFPDPAGSLSPPPRGQKRRTPGLGEATRLAPSGPMRWRSGAAPSGGVCAPWGWGCGGLKGRRGPQGPARLAPEPRVGGARGGMRG